MSALQNALREFFHNMLAELLSQIDAIDPSYEEVDPPVVTRPATNMTLAERYAKRNGLVLRALAYAIEAELPCGIGFDEKAGAEWPVVYIELPTGQVSWHLPAYSPGWDGHTTLAKARRITGYIAMDRR